MIRMMMLLMMMMLIMMLLLMMIMLLIPCVADAADRNMQSYSAQFTQVLLSGTTPDEICMPGTTAINMHTLIR